MRWMLAIGIVLTMGCAPKTKVPSDAIQEDISEDPIIHQELIEEAMDIEEVSSENDALRLLYEDALEARQTMSILLEEMDPKLRDALQEIFATFSENVDALQHYVDLSEREPLLEEDQRTVLVLSADIEEAMALFVQVLDVL